jgi:hypothetical protein
MKKTIGVMILSLGFTAPLFAQDMSATTMINKKELHNEKKQVNKEEKSVRREDRAFRNEEVSFQTMQAFKSDFPDAKDVGYMVGTNFDEVMYSKGSKDYIAYYNANGELVGTTSHANFSELPANARKTITKQYLTKGFNTDRVILFDDNELVPTDMWLYERSFDDEDNYFIELSKLDRKLVLQVDMKGNVSFYKDLKGKE